MGKLKFSLLLLVLFFPAVLYGGGGDGQFVLKGALVYTVTGPPIQNATIIVENGKIKEVGKNLSIPAGIKVYDITGKVITPGLVDIHTHMGLHRDDINEMPQPIGPENRAIDILNLNDPVWEEAVKGGVTTIVTGPGSGERMGGQSITIKTFGEDLDKRIVKEGGELKMAVNARNLSHIPSIRKTFIKAQEYKKKLEKYEENGKEGAPPKRDLALEYVVKALEGEELVRIHVIYANDILTLLKLKDEYGFDLTFIHSDEAFKVADEVAKRNVGCIVMPLSLEYGDPEDIILGNIILNDAGVKIAMHSDHPVVQEKWFRFAGAVSMRYGLPEDVALKSLTINPSEMSRLGHRIGSIEKGKDADIVVYNGPWYELTTRIDMVFVDGVLAYDRAVEELSQEENNR